MNGAIELWEETKPRERREFRNSDLLEEIDKLRDMAKDQMYWMADVQSENQKDGYKLAHQLASRDLNSETPPFKRILSLFVKKEPTAPAPIPIVAIFGASWKEDNNALAKAAYAVYWGENDKRNVVGGMEGKQSKFGAELCALKAALKNVIHILTRSEEIKFVSIACEKGICSRQNTLEIAIIAQQLEKVTLERLNRRVKNGALERAKTLTMERLIVELNEKSPQIEKKRALRRFEGNKKEETIQVTVGSLKKKPAVSYEKRQQK
ncbi:unnamed protein product [Caenorhabditis sp. 36 PRJEB53466]|nr:unnamed protein product [Caenorhabditis sp. 36 PRJEB53466]